MLEGRSPYPPGGSGRRRIDNRATASTISYAHDNHRLAGTVERVTCHSPECGFCVLRVQGRGQRELTTVTGSAAPVAPGEHLEAEGQWVNDRQYDLQFSETTGHTGSLEDVLPAHYYEIREARSLPRPLGEGWGEGTIRGEATFHRPGWLASPHDR